MPNSRFALHGLANSPSLIHGLCAIFASNSRFMRLFQAALDTLLDSPFPPPSQFTVCTSRFARCRCEPPGLLQESLGTLRARRGFATLSIDGHRNRKSQKSLRFRCAKPFRASGPKLDPHQVHGIATPLLVCFQGMSWLASSFSTGQCLRPQF